MGQPLTISAIICTHNRSNYLAGSIESLLNQTYNHYNILIIDNASTDNTKEVVNSYLSHPHVHYYYESALGLSSARNRGAKESNADILAYLDDDAIASPQWLKTLVESYQNNPKLAIAGGKVTLIYPENMIPPPWISENLSGALGYYDLGDQEILITSPILTPRGLNYSLRKTFLDSIGGFDLNLGRKGKNLLSNEELVMTELALNNNWEVRYLPTALVAHNVAPERLSHQWFLQRSWWQGVSEAYREDISNKNSISQIWQALERILRGLYKSVKFSNKSDLKFENLLYAYSQLGYLQAVFKNWLKL